MCFLRSFFFPRAAMMITCPGRQKTQLRNMTLMPNLIFFFGGGGIFRPAVAPVLSSVNTRVSRPGLEAHLHPLLSLKEFPSFRILTTDGGSYICLQAGLIAKLTSSSIYVYTMCSMVSHIQSVLLFSGLIFPCCMLCTLNILCHCSSVDSSSKPSAEIYSDQRLLWYMHKVAAFRRPHDRRIWFLNKRRHFAVCAVVPVRCPL